MKIIVISHGLWGKQSVVFIFLFLLVRNKSSFKRYVDFLVRIRIAKITKMILFFLKNKCLEIFEKKNETINWIKD